MKNKLIYIYIICFFLTFSFNNILSKNIDSLFYVFPEKKLANELIDGHIIMFGDYSHGQPGSYNNLMNILYNWLINNYSNQKSVELTLVLEIESIVAKEINDYLKTNDIKLVLNVINTEFYIETLEFYSKLRTFYQKIDSINKIRENKIFFLVQGFEDSSENLIKMSKKEQELWFINERDSFISNGIINYLKSNPFEQTIIFYGTGHLQDGYVNKNIGFDDIEENQSKGYYLVHYLKNEFGDKNVISVFTANFIDDFIKNPMLNNIKKQDILFKTNDINDSNWLYYNTDYIYSCHINYVPLIEANLIFSKYIIQKNLNNVKTLKQWLPGFKALSYYNYFLNSAFYFSDIKFKNDMEYENWFIKFGSDISTLLYKNKLDTLLLNFFDHNPHYDFVSYKLNRFGVENINFDTNLIQDYDKWRIYDFPNLMKQLKFTNSIGIYWIGYPDEKELAKKYLVEYSGQDYDEPVMYLQWYRKNILGVDY